MGRRYVGLSPTAIERMAASVRAKAAQQERENLISKQQGIETQLPVEYCLESVDFNIETRVAKAYFIATKYYRTIERYITQNYQRYPIYSNWKRKCSIIDKRLKLTNLALETLNQHDDELIRQFSADIILQLHRPELIPSWLAIKIIENDCSVSIDVENAKGDEKKKATDMAVKSYQTHIGSLQSHINTYITSKEILVKELRKKNTSIERIEKRDISKIKLLVTFGLYLLFFSKSYKNKLLTKKAILENQIKNLDSKITKSRTEIEQIEQSIDDLTDELNAYFAQIAENKKTFYAIRDEQLSKVVPLNSDIEQLSGFFALKDLAAFPYEKITGCYVIQNTEKLKYYVGQSKDVIKRLRQHFKGTVPKNIIFAEDYFSSSLPNKDELFRVKIIRLETKDELDDTERKLIEKYNANIDGYNSTKGNA